MAAQNLPSLSHPDFPQVFTPAIALAFSQSIDRLIARVKKGFPSTCEYEYPESQAGAGDGYPCSDPAVVFHLGAEHELCSKHYRKQALEDVLAEMEVSHV